MLKTTKECVIAGIATIIAICVFCVVFSAFSNDREGFPEIPGVTFFGAQPDEVQAHKDLIEYQNYDPERDDYDPDLIMRGEAAEEMARERAKEWQEEVLDEDDRTADRDDE